MQDEELIKALKKAIEAGAADEVVNQLNKALEDNQKIRFVINDEPIQVTGPSSQNNEGQVNAQTADFQQKILETTFDYSQTVLETSLKWNHVWRILAIISFFLLVTIWGISAIAIYHNIPAFAASMHVSIMGIVTYVGGLGTHSFFLDRNKRNDRDQELKELIRIILSDKK